MGKFSNVCEVISNLKKTNVVTENERIIVQDSMNNSVLVCIRIFLEEGAMKKSSLIYKIIQNDLTVSDGYEVSVIDNERANSKDVIIRINF